MGALTAAWFSVVTALVPYEEAGGHADSLDVIQGIVAWVGLLPVGLLIHATANSRRARALLLLAISLLVYAGWGLLNDAAVHGGE